MHKNEHEDAQDSLCVCGEAVPRAADLVLDDDDGVEELEDRHSEPPMAYWRTAFLKASRPDELLGFFRSFGLEPEYLATALGDVSPRSVRRWLRHGLPSTQPANTWRMLDDLRAIIGHFLADGTYDRIGIVVWLCSRQEELHYERPVDLLGHREFERVLTLAEQMTAPVRANNPKLRELVSKERSQASLRESESPIVKRHR